jgi:hypothetical protein
MAIDFKTFSSVAPLVSDARLPVLLRGRHGIGKSQVVYQIGKSLDIPVVERRASQMQEGDLLGLPELIDGQTRFCPPEWYAQACAEPVLLFLDEVDRATPEVRQGIFELTDSRKLSGHSLHPDTLIFAAVNGGEHGEQYQVGEMDPAELDRWTVFDLEPSTEDWLDWGKENIDGLVWDFINQNREHLEHKGDFEPNKVYPSRRSWHRLNDVLVGAGLLEKATPAIFTLSQSFVGFEAAVSFNDFAKNYERQVTVEQLLAGEKTKQLSKFSLNDHCALIEKVQAADALDLSTTDEQWGHLAAYMGTLPSEAAMKLINLTMGLGDASLLQKFHSSKCGDGDVGSYLNKLLQADK